MPTPTTFTLTTFPNFNRLPLTLTFVEDGGWPANTVTVTGRYQVNGRWLDLHDLVPNANGGARYDGSIFGLGEGWTVEIELRWLRTQTSNGALLEDLPITGSATTRVPPASGSGGTRYMSPLGNDTWTGINPTGGAPDGPRKTPVGLAAAIPDGGEGVMVDGIYGPAAANGSYTFSNATWSISGVNGAAGAYKTIRPQTPGGVTISGAIPIEKGGLVGSGGDWTKHATRVYWCDYSAHKEPSFIPRFVRNRVSKNVLFVYGGLDANVGAYVGINSATGQALGLEGWMIDWTNSRLYIRRAAADPDEPPTVDLYERSIIQNPLRFSQCNFWIVDGLKVEMFGWYTDGGSQYVAALGSVNAAIDAGAMRIFDCDDFVIRNTTCVAVSVMFDTGGNRDTLEDSSVTVNSVMEKLYDGTWDSTRWGYGHSAPANALPAVVAVTVGDRFVVRRNTLAGADVAVNMNAASSAVASNSDVYENTFRLIGDDTIEADTTSGNDGPGVNLAIWHNTFDRTNNTVSLSPFCPGPVWIVANFGKECGLFYHFKVGEAATGDGELNSVGWKLIYHNTCYTSVPASDGDPFHFNTGAGNIRAANNILRGSSGKYITDGGTTEYRAKNVFRFNCFFVPVPVLPWQYHGTGYPTEAAYIAAAGSDFELAGNVYIDPFPNGIDGPLNAALHYAATEVKGISWLAADATGNRIGVPGHFGYFPTFGYELVGDGQPQRPPRAVPPVLRLDVNARNKLRVHGLFRPSAVDGGYVNGATLRCKLYPANGGDVVAAFDIVFACVPGCDGVYEGWTVKLDMIEGRARYEMHFDDDEGFVHREVEAIALERTVK